MAEDLRRIVEHLASFERGSASEGERRAAEWIAAELREAGVDVAVEQERAHGGFWIPIGILTGLAGLAGLRARRAVAAIAGALTARGVWEELNIDQGRTRALLPKRPTYNVVGRTGDPAAARTIVISAHHDAPHAGLVFDPSGSRKILERHPWIADRLRVWPRVMWPVFLGPVLVALGAALGLRALRALGTALSLGSTAAMADIAFRPVVQGANDNLSGVAAVMRVARRLAADPVEGARVIVLSTGSEEGFEEGMWGFVRRHAAELDPATTSVLVVEMVGSPRFVVPDGEGFLFESPYDERLKDELSAAAAEAGVEAIRGDGVAFSTDALVAIKLGIPVAVLGSYDHLKLPVAYHWPDDTPDKLHYDGIERAASVLETAVRRLARGRS